MKSFSREGADSLNSNWFPMVLFCWYSTHKGWDLGLSCPLLSGDPLMAGRGRDLACACPWLSEMASSMQGKWENLGHKSFYLFHLNSDLSSYLILHFLCFPNLKLSLSPLTCPTYKLPSCDSKTGSLIPYHSEPYVYPCLFLPRLYIFLWLSKTWLQYQSFWLFNKQSFHTSPKAGICLPSNCSLGFNLQAALRLPFDTNLLIFLYCDFLFFPSVRTGESCGLSGLLLIKCCIFPIPYKKNIVLFRWVVWVFF